MNSACGFPSEAIPFSLVLALRLLTTGNKLRVAGGDGGRRRWGNWVTGIKEAHVI